MKYLFLAESHDLPIWVYILIIILFLIIFILACITRALKKTQEELHSSKLMLNDVINAIPVRVFWKDKESVYMGCNQLFADDTGRGSPENVVGDIDNNFAFADQADDYRADDRQVMDSGKAKINFEEPQTRPDGATNWLNTSKIPLRNKNGEIYGVLGTYEDITNRKKVEEELRMNEEQLRSVNANIPGVLYQFKASRNGEWKMHYVSDKANEIFGIDNEPSTFVERFIERLHPEDKQNFIDSVSYVVEHEIPWHFEGRFIRPDGETIYFNASSIPGRHEDGLIFHGLILDETEQHKMEERLHHSQKMEAVGQLAGGVAHDFNNMLGGIVMSAELLGNYLEDSDKARRFLQIIFNSANHASELTQQLLAFSRKQPSSLKEFSVHKVIADVGSILKNTVDKRISINVEIKAKKQTIFGDSSHVQSALLNLGINASHALPDGGIISILTDNVELTEEQCQNSTFDISPGEYIQISVEDNGCGIEAKHLEKIFDPFFTTKEQGKGTGLGLAAVYGTVRQHKGSIEVKSKLEQGTTFTILLPASDAKIIEESKKNKETSGKGNILLIDDEDVIRETVQAILESIGYKVDVAEDGKKGLELFESNPDKYDLVLMDMIMPQMNGKDCFRAIREIRGNMKIIVSSGYAEEEDLSKMQKEGLNGFLKKPYNKAVLSKTVSETLNQ